MSTTTYDTLPYTSHPFPQSHPDRLATVATLFGLEPPPVQKARVFEIGCAAGGNIIPIAEAFPESQCWGIDLSERQINDGKEFIAKLGLKNVKLEARNIMDVGADAGTFDYIVCHGVFSWVPREVQEKILAICKQHLAPNGIAYISYNTLPGWRMRGMIRDMMLYHAKQFEKPEQQVQQALALIDFLVQAAGTQASPYTTFLKEQLEHLRRASQTYIFHEYLESDNQAFYFHEFNAMAQNHGLQYLGEAQLPVMHTANLSEEVRKTLIRLCTDQIHLEQYLDFLNNRPFRQTLLSHQGITPMYTITPDRVRRLYVASNATPASAQPNLQSEEGENFDCVGGTKLTVRNPIMKAAMLVLNAAWPRFLSFAELCSAARFKLTPQAIPDRNISEADAQNIAASLIHFYSNALNGVELSTIPLPVATTPSDNPAVRPLARIQAEKGLWAGNLRHEPKFLDEFSKQLVMRMDGKRDRAALVNEMLGLVRRGTLNAQKDGKPITDEKLLRTMLGDAINAQLRELVKHSMLVE